MQGARMSSIQYDISALVPTLSKPSNRGIFSSRSSFDDWFNALPLANLSSLNDCILEALTELNRTRVTPRLRSVVLEKITEQVGSVINNARLQYRDAVFPLSDSLHTLGQLSLSILTEFTMAHLILINQLSSNGTSLTLLNKRKAAQSIHAMMRSSLHLIHKSSLLYQNVPGKFWRCLHTCYAFACSQGLVNRTYRNIIAEPDSRESTIQEAYCRILLLAISNLTSASQASIEQIYRATRLWASQTRVSLLRDDESLQPGQFAIDVKQTTLPDLVEESTSRPRADLVFDLMDLKHELRGMLDARAEGEYEVTLRQADGKSLIFDALLLDHILKFWDQSVNRSNDRVEGEHTFRFSMGLAGIHFQEAGNISFGYFLEQVRDDQFSKSREPISSQNLSVGKRRRSSLFNAELVNQSVGGYCLRLTETDQLKLRIGELIRLTTDLFDDRDQVHLIGTIRWLNAISPSELMIGVSIVGTDCRPAAIVDDLKEGTCSSALMVNNFSTELNDFCQYLFVQSYLPTDMKELSVAWYDDRRYWTGSLEIGELVQKSASFCMYRITNQYVSEEDRMIDEAVRELV